MKTHNNYLQIFLAVVAILFLALAEPAAAQIDLGRRNTFPSAFYPEGSIVAFKVSSDNSYCCEIDNASAPLRFTGVVNLTSTSGSPVATVRTATNDQPETWSRVCFTTPSNNTIREASLPTTYGILPPPTNVSFTCKETTLYGGFNTSVTDFNFLELTNTGVESDGIDRTLSVKVFAVNTVPNPDETVINGTTATISVGSRTDLDIHSAAGAGAFGPLKVLHTSAPGALKAVLNQYNITSTSPLDFSPVSQEVFRTRGELAGGGNWE